MTTPTIQGHTHLGLCGRRDEEDTRQIQTTPHLLCSAIFCLVRERERELDREPQRTDLLTMKAQPAREGEEGDWMW